MTETVEEQAKLKEEAVENNLPEAPDLMSLEEIAAWWEAWFDKHPNATWSEMKSPYKLCETADAAHTLAAENAELKRQAGMNERQLVDAYIHASAPALYEALKKAVDRLIDHANECGQCDHSVNICVCDLWREVEELQAALKFDHGEGE